MDSLFINKPNIHIRLQKLGNRNLTILENIDKEFDLKRICKAMRKAFSCNGQFDEEDLVIKLQGDQRQNVKEWLLANQIILPSEQDRIIIHGY
jgi:translation initiation factor 1